LPHVQLEQFESRWVLGLRQNLLPVDALNKDPKTEKRWSKTETKGLPSKFRAQMNVAVAAVVVVAVAVVVAAVVDDGQIVAEKDQGLQGLRGLRGKAASQY
jgi:hypothetical protein